MADFHHQGDHGDPTGPYPDAKIRDLIKRGIIKSHHRLRTLDDSTWVEVSILFPNLFPSSPGPDQSGGREDRQEVVTEFDSEKEWHFSVGRNREESEGPISLEELQDLVMDGALDPTAKIWKNGWPDWRDAGEVGPLADLWPSEPAKSTTRGKTGGAGPVDSISSRMPTSAISSLILGLSSIMFAGGSIASFLFQQWSLMIVMGLVFLLTSILAVVLGHLSLSTIKKQPDAWSGRGVGMAGVILGYVSLGATAVIAVVLLFVVVLQVGQVTR